MPSLPCTVLRDAVLVGGRLFVSTGETVKKNSSSSTKSLKLTTRYMESGKRISVLRGGPMPHCKRRIERAVIAAVPGDFGCRQVAHFLYNFVLPMWHTLKLLGWLHKSPLPQLFLDCSGTSSRGTSLATAPEFVAAATRVLTSAPVEPLLLTRPSTSSSGTCFDEVLVGCSCGELDHYNRQLASDAQLMAGFEEWRDALMATVLRRPAPLLEVGHAATDGLAVLLVGRKRNRLWLNAREVAAAVRGLDGVRSASLVYFEGATLAQQMQVVTAADVLMGVDGTGLSNGNWLRAGSSVIDIMPYFNAVARPDLSSNFRRMWAAVGVHVQTEHARANESTLPTLVDKLMPWCRRCLVSGRLRGTKASTANASRCEVAPGRLMWCLDLQNTHIPTARAVGFVQSVVQRRKLAGGKFISTRKERWY